MALENHKILINALRFGLPVLLMVFAALMQWKRKNNRPLPRSVTVASFLAVIVAAISFGYLLAFYSHG